VSNLFIISLDRIERYLRRTTHADNGEIADMHVRRSAMAHVLSRVKYDTLTRSQRGLIVTYLCRITGYAREHASRLVRQYQKTHSLKSKRAPNRTSFIRTYSSRDIRNLAELDHLHNAPPAPVTRTLIRRAVEYFDKDEYVSLLGLSSSHIYNLRRSGDYLAVRNALPRGWWPDLHMRSRVLPASMVPGHIAVYCTCLHSPAWLRGVHQIHARDLVTHWEYVIFVERLNDALLRAIWSSLNAAFPFNVLSLCASGNDDISDRLVAFLQHIKRSCAVQPYAAGRIGLPRPVFETHDSRRIISVSAEPHRGCAAFNDGIADDLSTYLNLHLPGYGRAEIARRLDLLSDGALTPYERLLRVPGFAAYLRHDAPLSSLGASSIVPDNEAALRVQQAIVRVEKLLHGGLTSRIAASVAIRQ
jgi:hypothetical protein